MLCFLVVLVPALAEAHLAPVHTQILKTIDEFVALIAHGIEPGVCVCVCVHACVCVCVCVCVCIDLMVHAMEAAHVRPLFEDLADLLDATCATTCSTSYHVPFAYGAPAAASSREHLLKAPYAPESAPAPASSCQDGHTRCLARVSSVLEESGQPGWLVQKYKY